MERTTQAYWCKLIGMAKWDGLAGQGLGLALAELRTTFKVRPWDHGLLNKKTGSQTMQKRNFYRVTLLLFPGIAHNFVLTTF